jgi:photosystem II stability/assembly factor-like uncharacterized protein
MKRSLPILLAAFSAALAVQARAAAPSWRLFASLSMTKTQVNSPMPDTSGAFLRLGDGKWAHFGGDQIKWVNSLAVNPADPRVIYLGCGNGILRSRDDGRSWRLTTDWHEADVLGLQVDASAPARVYAATGWGIWRSTDGGETWAESDKGLPMDGKFTYAIVIDSSNHSRLLAGTDVGLFVSTDSGTSWAPVPGAPKAPVLHLEQAVADPTTWLIGTLGQGALISTDGGGTWTPAAPDLARANVYGAAIDPADTSHLAVAGWAQGVRVSEDGGRSWRNASHGLPVAHVSAMVFDRERTGRLWASTFEEGTFYTDDSGRTWVQGGLYGAYVSELRFVPAPR